MIIDCTSDLHGHLPKLEGGDLLIVAGDLTARDTPEEFQSFFDWLSIQDYEKAIIIAGNHDNLLQKGCVPFLELDKPLDISIQYICDSGTEFEGLKIWGSPWTKRFKGMNPHCMAFTVDTDEELAEKWAMIPDDIDILITHSPPIYLFDQTFDKRTVGSKSLGLKFKKMNHKLHVFGHIHESYGYEEMKRMRDGHVYKVCNASHVNERYQPVNNPIRITI